VPASSREQLANARRGVGELIDRIVFTEGPVQVMLGDVDTDTGMHGRLLTGHELELLDTGSGAQATVRASLAPWSPATLAC
jgi:hypothetical protein